MFTVEFSAQNVHKLMRAVVVPIFPTFPEFIQLLDDDTVSPTDTDC